MALGTGTAIANGKDRTITACPGKEEGSSAWERKWEILTRGTVLEEFQARE
jgi:hypothetical protein